MIRSQDRKRDYFLNLPILNIHIEYYIDCQASNAQIQILPTALSLERSTFNRQGMLT